MLKLLSIPVIILTLLISTGLSPEQDKNAEEKSKTKCGETKILEKKQGKYKGKPGDFFFRDAYLQNVLLYFARTYKFNIVIDPGISGKVTCRLVQVPWDQALAVILKQHGLAMEQDGKVVRVINLNKLK
ncbi:MAG: secretin and TonB N-terminal domain-containing protein [Candidatus Aminicenantes bacterium]|nr:secretin and TonB N-terminal domain-containing protein [Candidatus Aminicenantes bacterium]